MIEQDRDATPMTLGYMTSLYARASDWFIRGEVAELRAMGHTVHTFSIRRSDPKEAVSEDVAREQANTVCLIEAGLPRLVLATLRRALRSPGRMREAVRVSRKLSNPGLKGRLWPWAYLLEAAWLADRLEEKGISHLHNHIGENSASVAMLASILSGVPFSMTIHGPNEFDYAPSFAYGEKIRRSAFTACISEYGRSQLFRYSDYTDWPKVQVVRSGVGRKFLEHGPSAVPDEPRFVCIGRLCEAKGQLLLVEAAARLAAERLEFEIVLIGDGPMRVPIETLIDQHGLRGHVTIAGWMGSDAVLREVLRSRALLLPSFAEGLPMVIMEALALGRPVISTYVGGIPELVEPGACGWLVPSGSIEPLVDAIRCAIHATPDELGRMGREGAARVAEKHDIRREVGKLAAWFRGAEFISKSINQSPATTPVAPVGAEPVS